MITTALGSFPGIDMAETMRALLEICEHRAPIAELPLRGSHASMIARTASMLPEMPFDLQPSGWRFSSGSSLVERRARAMLTDDVTITAEQLQDWAGILTLTLAGPWTLAASIDRFRAGKAVGDAGARRDIGQAWVSGVGELVAHVHSQLGREIAIQIDEPSLLAVLEGAVSDESGRKNLSAVDRDEVTETLSNAVSAARTAGGDIVIMHCCAAPAPVELMAKTGIDALSFDTANIEEGEWEFLSEWVRTEPRLSANDDKQIASQLWLGVAQTTGLLNQIPNRDIIARETDRCLSNLDATKHDDITERIVLTPACGLAGAANLSDALHLVEKLTF